MFLPLKKFGHFGRCVITLDWGLSCISLMLNEVGPFDHLEISFLKYMFKPFACFFLGLCIFLNIYLTISLYLPYMTIIRYLLYFYLLGVSVPCWVLTGGLSSSTGRPLPASQPLTGREKRGSHYAFNDLTSEVGFIFLLFFLFNKR